MTDQPVPKKNGAGGGGGRRKTNVSEKVLRNEKEISLKEKGEKTGEKTEAFAGSNAEEPKPGASEEAKTEVAAMLKKLEQSIKSAGKKPKTNALPAALKVAPHRFIGRPGEKETLNYEGVKEEIVSAVESYLNDIFILLNSNGYSGKTDEIKEAAAVATYCHQILAEKKKQYRKNGKPMITHPLDVARSIANEGLDELTVVYAILHDVHEDCKEEIKEKFDIEGLDFLKLWFGDVVAGSMDSLTKVKTNFEQDEEDKKKTHDKILEFASKKDLRALLVKIFDRYENMRDVSSHKNPATRARISEETLAFYVPLAKLLLMTKVAKDLVKWSVDELFEAQVKNLEMRLWDEKRANTEWLNEVLKSVLDKLPEDVSAETLWPEEYDLYDFRAGVPLKDRFNPYKKLVPTFRLIFKNVNDIYKALGVIHTQYEHSHNMLLDTINTDLVTSEKSVRTTIKLNDRFINFVLLTQELLERNENGILYNWRAASIKTDPYFSEILTYLMTLSGQSDPHELANAQCPDHASAVNAYTPKAQCLQFPIGATALDFAYAIHREIGNHAVSALINGKKRGVEEQLREGDTVEINTDPDAKPDLKWIEFVKTRRAREAINDYLKFMSMNSSRTYGEQIVKDYVKFAGYNPDEILSGPEFFHLLQKAEMPIDEFYSKVGLRRIALWSFLADIVEPPQFEVEKEKLLPFKIYKRRVVKNYIPRIIVSDPHDRFFTTLKCCHALQGEPNLVGVMGEGDERMSLHREDCVELKGISHEQMARVIWRIPSVLESKPQIILRITDRPKILFEVLSAIASEEVNIESLKADTIIPEAKLALTLDIRKMDKLLAVCSKLRKIKGVTKLRWVKSD